MNTVHSNNCGTLSSVIADKEVEELQIEGNINQADLRFLASLPCLKRLDLSLAMGLECIGANDFYGNNHIESVVLSDGTVSVSELAFTGCGALAEINVTDKNRSFSSYGSLLLSKDGTVLVKCAEAAAGDLVIPEGVKKIASYAFCNCNKVSSIKLPQSLEEIEERGIYACNGISELHFPKNVRKITDVSVRKCASVEKYSADKENVFLIEEGGMICQRTTRHGKNVTALSLVPNAVVNDAKTPSCANYLDRHAFDYCSKVKRIIIGSNIEACDEPAFEGLNNLYCMVALGEFPPYCYRSHIRHESLPTKYIYSPKGTLQNYKKTPYWNGFLFNVEIDDSE